MITWNLSIDDGVLLILLIQGSEKKYNSLAGAALFGRVPRRRDDDEAGTASTTTVARYADRMPRASPRLASTRGGEIFRPLPPPRRRRRRRRRRLPPGAHATVASGLDGATSVTSALLLPRPQNEPAERRVNDVSGLVVETAPRRCNHLTRASIARQATRRKPRRASTRVRVTAS